MHTLCCLGVRAGSGWPQALDGCQVFREREPSQEPRQFTS